MYHRLCGQTARDGCALPRQVRVLAAHGLVSFRLLHRDLPAVRTGEARANGLRSHVCASERLERGVLFLFVLGCLIS